MKLIIAMILNFIFCTLSFGMGELIAEGYVTNVNKEYVELKQPSGGSFKVLKKDITNKYPKVGDKVTVNSTLVTPI